MLRRLGRTTSAPAARPITPAISRGSEAGLGRLSNRPDERLANLAPSRPSRPMPGTGPGGRPPQPQAAAHTRLVQDRLLGWPRWRSTRDYVPVHASRVPPTRLEPWLPEGEPRALFTHPFHPTVLEEDLRLPNGQQLTCLRYADGRDGPPTPDGVMVICQMDDCVLLSRQYNPGAGKVVWEFAGGGTHPGESYEEAARRETMEEVGLAPGHLRPLGRFLVHNRRSSWGIRVYLGTDLEEKALLPDIAELIETTFISVPEVDAMIVSGEIDNVTALAGWALFRAAGA